MMTSATVLFAMLPLALKLQDGGESRAPLAVVIMGGVLSSTLLTLVLVPAVYTILDDAKTVVGRVTSRLPRLQPRRASPASGAWQPAFATAGNASASSNPSASSHVTSPNGHVPQAPGTNGHAPHAPTSPGAATARDAQAARARRLVRGRRVPRPAPS